MSEEKTKKKPKSKITSFSAYRDEIEDPGTDHFLRESIMKETDELEARLNSDPKLAGISASDDMFDMIVGKLKAQGYWEEDEEDDKYTEHDDVGDVCAEDQEMKENPAEEKKRIVIAAQEMPYEDRDSGEEVSEERLQSAEEKGAGEQSKAEAEKVFGEQLETAFEKYSGEQSNAETEKVFEAQPETTFEKIYGEQPETAFEKLYGEQPEEVLRLMERGRKAEQEEKEKARRRVRRNRFVRRTAAAVAVFVLLTGAGFSTEASRGWILKMWDAAMEGFGFKAKTNYMENGVETRIKSEEEQEAVEKIKDNMSILVPDFAYLPEEMKFLEYEILNNNWEARMLYSYQENIISVNMVRFGKSGVSYYTLDNEAVLIDKFKNSQDIEIELWQENLGIEDRRYMAEFEYEDCRYVLNGVFPLEEIKKILEIMIIL